MFFIIRFRVPLKSSFTLWFFDDDRESQARADDCPHPGLPGETLRDLAESWPWCDYGRRGGWAMMGYSESHL